MNPSKLSHNDIIGLAMLEQLEAFRHKIAEGTIQAGSVDWTVRMCEAVVAEYTQFNNRAEWEEQL